MFANYLAKNHLFGISILSIFSLKVDSSFLETSLSPRTGHIHPFVGVTIGSHLQMKSGSIMLQRTLDDDCKKSLIFPQLLNMFQNN